MLSSTPLRYFLLASLFLCLPAVAGAQAFTGTVVDVKNGDTIEIRRTDGIERTIHLHGIDAPEMCQPFGPKATKYVVGRVHQKTVAVHVVNEDRYGRLAARVKLENGSHLNALLVLRGLAWWHEEYTPEAVGLQALQQQAQNAERGLWSQADPIAPWDWRNGIRRVCHTE